MHVGVDLDGTVDLDPANMASLMTALRAAGHRVSVLTGASTKHPTQDDLDNKADYLRELGMGSAWDSLVVFPSPPAKPKAKWCRKHHVDILIDNDANNAQAASKHCAVLVPWNSVIPASLKDELKDTQ